MTPVSTQYILDRINDIGPYYGDGLCGVFADGLSKYLADNQVDHEVRYNEDHAVVIISHSTILHAAPWNPDEDDYPMTGNDHGFLTSEYWSECIRRFFAEDLSIDEFQEVWTASNRINT